MRGILLIPVKSLSTAKQRLADALSHSQRSQLAEAMLRDVMAAAAGVLGGLGGALLVLTVSGTFVEGVTAGRGFLALGIVVFARWKPLRLVPASLLVGGATALQYRLQAGGSSIPYAVFLALPGLLSLAALAFSAARGGAPRALGTEAP